MHGKRWIIGTGILGALIALVFTYIQNYEDESISREMSNVDTVSTSPWIQVSSTTGENEQQASVIENNESDLQAAEQQVDEIMANAVEQMKNLGPPTPLPGASPATMTLPFPGEPDSKGGRKIVGFDELSPEAKERDMERQMERLRNRREK